MPTVPLAERKEKLAPLRIPTISQPRDVGVARGVRKVTEAAVGTLGGMQDAAADAKLKIDNAMILEADYRTSMLKTNLEIERNQLKGRAASGAVKAIEKKYRLGTEEIRKGLGNDTQIAAYAGREKHHWAGAGGLYESTLKYEASEIDKFSAANYNAVLDLRVKSAVERADEPEIFEQSLAELKAIIKDRNPDAVVAEDIYNDYVKTINIGIKERRIETERAIKAEADKLNLEANNDLSDLIFNDELSFSAINSREGILRKDYERWVKLYKKSMDQKEKEAKTGKKAIDNADVNNSLSVEAMTMPADITTEKIFEFKERVANEVTKGKLTPKTARTIIGDAERTLKLDPARKSSEDDVIRSFKNDYNDDLYGEAGSDEARVEYNRQIVAFRKWSAKNLDKEPIEYYEMVSEKPKRAYVENLFHAIGFGEPDPTRKERRKEIEAEAYLNEKEWPVTPANIKYVLENR